MTATCSATISVESAFLGSLQEDWNTRYVEAKLSCLPLATATELVAFHFFQEAVFFGPRRGLGGVAERPQEVRAQVDQLLGQVGERRPLVRIAGGVVTGLRHAAVVPAGLDGVRPALPA